MPNKATSVSQIISYPETRAVQFAFTMANGKVARVTFDLLAQPQFNGRTYTELETAAIAGMLADGRTDIKGFTHYLVS